MKTSKWEADPTGRYCSDCLLEFQESTPLDIEGKCCVCGANYGSMMRFDAHGNRVNKDGSLWNLDGKLAARNGNE